MKYRAHLVRILVGFGVTFIVLAFVVGNLADTALFVAASIICTAGISLILWLPLTYGVGWLTLIVIRFVRGMLDAEPASAGQAQAAPPAATSPALTNDQRAVINYVKQARAKGLKDAEISLKLQRNGWTAESIQFALPGVEG
jgi:MFS family permease